MSTEPSSTEKVPTIGHAVEGTRMLDGAIWTGRGIATTDPDERARFIRWCWDQMQRSLMP